MTQKATREIRQQAESMGNEHESQQHTTCCIVGGVPGA